MAKSNDLISIYNNHVTNRLHPTHEKIVADIDAKVKELEMALSIVDTVEIDRNPEEISFYHKVEFKNSEGVVLKILEYYASDHSSSKTISYLNDKGDLIYEQDKSDWTVGMFASHTTSHEYFLNGKRKRTKSYRSVSGYANEYIKDCIEFYYSYVPVIIDNE